MSEGTAASAAPVAAPSSNAAPDAGAPADAQIANVEAKGSRARMNDGRFAPKEGNASAEAEEAPAEQKPPEYRFKQKLKVYGKEEDVDYGEADLKRELQVKRALESKVGKYAEAHRKAEQIIALAKQDPKQFMKLMGHDVDHLSRSHLAEQAKQMAMTDEERMRHELQQENQALKSEKEQRIQQEKEVRAQQTQDRLVKQNVETYIPALEKSGLPKTYESLEMLVATAKEAFDDHGIEYTPDELASETKRRLNAKVATFLGNLSGSDLVRHLGPKVTKAILQHELEQFQSQQSFQAPPTSAPTMPSKEPEAREYIDDAEIARRMRALK